MTGSRPSPPPVFAWRPLLPSGLRLGLLMLASALTEGVGIVLLVPMLGLIGAGQPGGQGGGHGSGRVSAALAALGVPLRLDVLLMVFVALVLVRAVVVHARALAALTFEARVVDGLRNRAWDALLHAEWRTVLGLRQSDTVSLLITNIDRVGLGVNQAIVALATAVTLAGIGAAALTIAPRVTLGAVLAGALVLLAQKRVRRQAITLGAELTDAYERIHGEIDESLSGLRVVKSLGREAQAQAAVAGAFGRLRAARMAFQRDLGFGQIALQGGGAAALAALIWLALVRQHADPAGVLPLVALFARALPLLSALQEAWQNWAYARPAFAATRALIERAEAAREPDGEAMPGSDTVAALALAEAITLDGVVIRFAGPDAGHDAAALDVSLTIPAGQVLMVTGPSGAGKSTLADLLGGLLSPDAGTIAVDGAVLAGATRRQWRGRVAYVQQEPVLLAASLRDNLRWAVAEASDSQIRTALASASAGFVENWPDGLDTRIGAGGRRLSGGERQRIVLARALLREPALLILDEATSALDAANEQAIRGAVAALKGRLTMVVIGHRGALAGLADRVVTLDRGRVVADRPGSVVPEREPD